MKKSKLKKFIPWWLRILFKIILKRIPLLNDYNFWQKYSLFRHGSMDNCEYSYNVFFNHRKKLNSKSLKGKLILEVGPGDGISTALIAASFGASSILIDADNFAKKDISYLVKLSNFLKKKGLNCPDVYISDTLEEVLFKCNSRYLTKGLESFYSLQENSVDLIFSQAVLEHVYKSDFFYLIREFYRICKLDGICSHQVDLRDHLGGGLNNLRFSEDLWESEFFKKSGFYTNRIQFEEMIEIFNKVGFSCHDIKINRWEKLPLSKNKMSSQFKDLSINNLNIKSFDVILKK